MRTAPRTRGRVNRLACRPGRTIYKGKYLDQSLETDFGTIKARIWDSDAAPAEPAFIHWSHDTCTVMDP